MSQNIFIINIYIATLSIKIEFGYFVQSYNVAGGEHNFEPSFTSSDNFDFY